jgi:hypothetical protein
MIWKWQEVACENFFEGAMVGKKLAWTYIERVANHKYNSKRYNWTHPNKREKEHHTTDISRSTHAWYIEGLL